MDTTDPDLLKVYTVVITGSVNSSPVVYGATPLTFTVTLGDNMCVRTRIVDSGITDIAFEISSHNTATRMSWSAFTFNPALSCGGITYDLPVRYEAAANWPAWISAESMTSNYIDIETTDP